MLLHIIEMSIRRDILVSSIRQFYFEEDTLIFNNSATVESLEYINQDVMALKGIVNFDLRLVVNSIKTFLNKLLNLVLSMNVKGVTMYVSEELDYLSKSYEEQNCDLCNNNPMVIFNSPNKIDVVFFNGIEKISVKEIKNKLIYCGSKKVVFNFSNLDITSLNHFIPTFIGWMINSGLKDVSFSKHYGEIDSLLERKGVYCMVKVSNIIAFPKRKSEKVNNIKNKKIDRFLRFANYGALQF